MKIVETNVDGFGKICFYVVVMKANHTALRIGDSVRLSTPWSDGSIVSYWAKCYRIADDGRAAIHIPAKVMSLKFPPFPKDRMLITNEIPEASVKRASNPSV